MSDSPKVEPDTVWLRIKAELDRRHESSQWLTEGIGIRHRQAFYNWKYRGGVPHDKYQAIADLLGWTVDELLGRSELVQSERSLSAMAVTLGLALDKIEIEDAKLLTFSHCLGVIAQVSGVPPDLPRVRQPQRTREESKPGGEIPSGVRAP
jgi:hypothetical protein